MFAEVGQDEKQLISMCVSRANRRISGMLETRLKESSNEMTLGEKCGFSPGRRSLPI